MSKAKLGSGKRFKVVKDKVQSEYEKKGMNPVKAKAVAGAVAAKVGRLKYGANRMAKMASSGK